MKILENALSLDLLKLCQEELNSKLKNNEWRSSSLYWVPLLTQGVSGSTLTTYTSLDIKNAIKKEISPYIPECDIVAQYYVWQPNSGISLHGDAGYKFGATIYLNEQWHPDAGGWFIWSDNERWNTLLPTKNLMVLNDKHEKHLVTSIASDTPEFRHTIQIWGIR